MRLGAALAIFILVTTQPAHGDTPLEAPVRHEVRSPAGTVVAVSDPERGTTVSRTQSAEVLWSLPRWYRWLFVSDDGEHMITADFGSLIPADYSDDLVLFTCWKNGQRVGEVRLADVVPDKAILKPTISHFLWGSVEQFTEKNELILKRVDGQHLHFRAATCGKAEQEPSSEGAKDARR